MKSAICFSCNSNFTSHNHQNACNLVLSTSVESCNKTLHFQAGDGPLLDKIELPPDLYISQLVYSLTPIYAGNFYRRSRAIAIANKQWELHLFAWWFHSNSYSSFDPACVLRNFHTVFLLITGYNSNPFHRCMDNSPIPQNLWKDCNTSIARL